jgi:octaprenyl-diphosphate synthase
MVEQVFDKEVTSSLAFLDGLCDVVRSYRGKMLRPALVLLSGYATGTVHRSHHVLGAVVEMVHMATLVHDDVLDRATERRRQPTIATLSGNTAAVLLGDYLISHAFHLCSSLDSQYASRLIGATTNTVCEGEMLQNHHAGDLSISEAVYFDIIERKTASLTAACCALGAREAGATEEVVAAMTEYGRSAGIAFQIVDDILDVVGDDQLVGKTLGRDADLGKATLPMIHCLRDGSLDDQRVLREALERRSADAATTSPTSATEPAATGDLAEILRRSGSLAYARAEADRQATRALTHLEVLAPSEARDALQALAEFIVSRRL